MMEMGNLSHNRTPPLYFNTTYLAIHQLPWDGCYPQPGFPNHTGWLFFIQHVPDMDQNEEAKMNDKSKHDHVLCPR